MWALARAALRWIEQLREAAVICQEILKLLELLALLWVLVLGTDSASILYARARSSVCQPQCQIVDVLLEIPGYLLLRLTERPELGSVAVLTL